MICKCERFRKELERKKGRVEQVREDLADVKLGLGKKKEEAEDWSKVQAIIQEVAQKTQQELEYHISELVSLALSDVFPDPYKLGIEFCLRRNKTEADIYFSKEGSEERFNPISSSGGGAVDIACLALRISLWNLTSPRKRNCIIFDEPLRFLSKDLQPLAGKMIKDISNKLGIQIIMVTHEKDLVIDADACFPISIKKGISEIGMAQDEEKNE